MAAGCDGGSYIRIGIDSRSYNGNIRYLSYYQAITDVCDEPGGYDDCGSYWCAYSNCCRNYCDYAKRYQRSSGILNGFTARIYVPGSWFGCVYSSSVSCSNSCVFQSMSLPGVRISYSYNGACKT